MGCFGSWRPGIGPILQETICPFTFRQNLSRRIVLSEHELPPSGELRSPMTVTEWRLCRPGDVIRLFWFEVLITEENCEPFMREIGHLCQLVFGRPAGAWIIRTTIPAQPPGFKRDYERLHCERESPDLGKVFGPAGWVLATDTICFRRWRAAWMKPDHQPLGQQPGTNP